MKSRKFLMLAILAFVLTLIWLKKPTSVSMNYSDEGPSASVKVYELTPSPVVSPEKAAVKPQTEIPKVEVIKDRPVVALNKIEYPSDEEIRSQAVANPEVMPKALIGFITSVHDQVEQALESEPAAKTLTAELGRCAAGQLELKNSTARAFCMVSMRRLRAKFPDLASDYNRYVAMTDSRIMRLAQMVPNY